MTLKQEFKKDFEEALKKIDDALKAEKPIS